MRAKLKDVRAYLSRREWHDREVILKRIRAQYSAGKFKRGLSDYIDEIVELSLVDLPEKKKVMLDDTDEENCFDSSYAESDRDLSDVELNDRRREEIEPSDDEGYRSAVQNQTNRAQDWHSELQLLFTTQASPAQTNIIVGNWHHPELDTVFNTPTQTTSAPWIQPAIEDLCRSYEEAGETVVHASSSQAAVSSKTPVFDMNNNCTNYNKSQHMCSFC